MKTPQSLVLVIATAVFGSVLSPRQCVGECPPKVPLVIGGFGVVRSGNASFPAGAYFSQARSAVLTNFPQTTFASFTNLTLEALASVDLVVIGSVADNAAATSPLTPEEQTTLLSFIKRGGSAVILSDNYSFHPLAPAANASVLAPFGMAADGTLNGVAAATVLAPSNHAVTSGSFGSVSSFTQNYPGGFTNLGPFATALAGNALGVALAVIEVNALGAGSGRVVIYSDGNTFWNDGFGLFSANTVLFLNTIDYCRRPPCPPILAIERDGSGGFYIRYTGVPDVTYRLQRAAGVTGAWSDLATNTAPASGLIEYHDTSPLPGQAFYRAVQP